MTSFKKKREKDVVRIIVTFDLIGLLPPITLFLILRWHMEVCEEMVSVNRKIAQRTQNI